MAWRKLHAWSPFKIDALGLLTILGADEINQAVGRLTESPIIDWQPQLAAHVIASNQFAKPLSGFNLYNVSDGILATDLAGWFARWLLQQDLAWNTSIIYMSKAQPSRPLRWIVFGYVLGVCTSAAVFVTAGLLRDWWGLTNAISMAVSVMVRQFLVKQNRKAIDVAVSDTKGDLDKVVKVFLTMPTGKAVTVIASRGVVINCLLTTPRPPHPFAYKGVQMAGWVVFGCHIISLGMTTLLCQLLTVPLLVVATVLKVYGFSEDQSRIGTFLLLQRVDPGRRDFRAAAYARLELSKQEEDSMVQWNLFPHKSNTRWWERYRECRQDKYLQSFEMWDKKLAA